MPVNPTYPGIYIEELPSTNFTITPAPTSVAVFIGYTHPFKTKAFGKAVPVFNFTEFERAFGGYIASGVFSGQVSLAISQFFLNGGSDAYVVGLKPQYHTVGAPTDVLDPALSSLTEVPLAAPVMNPQATFAKGATDKLVVYGLEPTDQVEMRVAFFPKVGDKTADIRVTYGSQVELFRDVDLTDDDRPTGIKAIVNSLSQLIRIRKSSVVGATFPTGFNFDLTEQPLMHGTPAGANTFAEDDFTAVLKDDVDLDKVPVFNLMIIPGMSQKAVLDRALAYCERKLAFFIMDPPPLGDIDKDGDTVLEMQGAMDKTAKHVNGAIYYPELVATHPLTKRRIELPPSGTVAGVFARTDTQFGVWKAPAGIETTVRGVTGVVEIGRVTNKRHGLLNEAGVNVLRTFPGIGTVVYGARTLESANKAQEQWKYVPVRRMALFIEQTLLANLTWVVFRPNDEPLWAAIRASITGFMMSLFRQGAFQGDSPSKAFQVKCDAETTTQTDINLGKVNIVVAFAPLKPAEFVIIKIAQLAGQAEA
jgi:uncharacterized protein